MVQYPKVQDGLRAIIDHVAPIGFEITVYYVDKVYNPRRLTHIDYMRLDQLRDKKVHIDFHRAPEYANETDTEWKDSFLALFGRADSVQLFYRDCNRKIVRFSLSDLTKFDSKTRFRLIVNRPLEGLDCERSERLKNLFCLPK